MIYMKKKRQVAGMMRNTLNFQLYIITTNKLASSVSATEALAKEHREHRIEPLAVVSAAFPISENPNGSLAYGCRYFYI